MSLRVTCPTCGTDFPVQAGLVEGEAKRLGAVLAGMEPVLGRAALHYLALFKPAKSALRLNRAIRLLAELAELADAGTVCRDGRTSARRPASAALWAAGIEQMLMQRERLELPLDGHNYLRKVVYGLADAADAQHERQHETDLRQGRRLGPSPAQPREDRLTNQLAWLRQQRDLAILTPDAYATAVADAKQRLGGRHD